MHDRPTWVYIAGYALLAVVLAGLSMVASRTYLEKRQPEEVAQSTIVSQTHAPDRPVTRVTYESGLAVYTLTGRLTSDLVRRDNTIQTTFVLDGDPQKTEIPVIFLFPQGILEVFTYQGSLDGTYTPEELSPTLVLERVKNGVQARLLLRFPKEDTDPARQVLDRLLRREWPQANELTLRPTRISIVSP